MRAGYCWPAGREALGRWHGCRRPLRSHGRGRSCGWPQTALCPREGTESFAPLGPGSSGGFFLASSEPDEEVLCGDPWAQFVVKGR